MTGAGVIGTPHARIDGREKVTGAARYAMDARTVGQAYGHLVTSSVASGRVSRIDVAAAERAPGVMAVITHLNAPRLSYGGANGEELHGPVDPGVGRHLRLLQDDGIHFAGQIVAVVVADTRERAEHAASLVISEYERSSHVTGVREAIFGAHDSAVREARPDSTAGFDEVLPGAQEPLTESKRAKPRRGSPARVFDTAEIRLDSTYRVPVETHNPIGTISTLAEWQGDRLALHDTTQWTYGVREHVAWVFGLKPDKVSVAAPFTGGAFGCTLRCWPHVAATAMAAKVVGRPVKLTLTRAQMFAATGARPETLNRIRLSATPDGKLTSIEQSAFSSTSRYEEFVEPETDVTRFLYACQNVSTSYRVVPLDVQTPTYMRAPGENTNVFALECAMDELAYELDLDPVELRLRNHDFDSNPDDGKPWTSNGLRECYAEGAAAFGWSKRDARPRSMRVGRMLVGYGMAAATYPTNRLPASAAVTIKVDGTAEVRSASTDIGVGTYTALAQIAGDALGLPVEKVNVQLGDTALPKAPFQGGSNITASVGSAVHEAALEARAAALSLASADPRSVLRGSTDDQVSYIDGSIRLVADGSRHESYADILRRAGREHVDATIDVAPDKVKTHSAHSFAVRFAEVRVDPDTGVVHLHRFLSVNDGGRIVNPRQANSQAMGGMLMGLGMALFEQTKFDRRYGRIVNANLADYAVATNADVPIFESLFVEVPDLVTTPIGVKGIGEIVAVGVAPAIVNAIFHATGRRVRNLPITPEALL